MLTVSDVVAAVGDSLIFGWTVQFLQALGLVKFLK
jgi:hypothetical protein